MRRNILLLIAALVFSLGGAEAILTVFDIPKFYRAHSGPPQFRFIQTGPMDFIYTNVPSTDICFEYDGDPRNYFEEDNTVCHSTNAMGFRGHEFQEEKQANEIRIGILGDSFTCGEGVKDADTYCSQTEARLSEKYLGKTVRVMNFGVGGYNTEQEWELFNGLVSSLKIDILAVAMTLNDAEPKLFYLDPADTTVKRRSRESAIHEGLADSEPPPSSLNWSRIYRLLWKVLNDRQVTDQTVAYYNSLYVNGTDPRLAQQSAIRNFSELATRDSLPLVTMLFPVFYRLGADYPFKHIHHRIRSDFESASPKQFLFLDLKNAYDGFEGPELWVHPTDQHPNELAHGIAAERLTIALVPLVDRVLGQ